MQTILVIDDDPDVLELARDVLAASGYEVLEARDGEEALRIAEARPAAIDLLLTDVVMPGINGVEVANRLTGRRPDTKVLYMSGFTVVGAQADAVPAPSLEPGTPILPKPFSPEVLTRKVREVLERPAPPRSPFSRPRAQGEQWWP